MSPSNSKWHPFSETFGFGNIKEGEQEQMKQEWRMFQHWYLPLAKNCFTESGAWALLKTVMNLRFHKWLGIS
jgi:hypothetical protein